MSDSSKSGSIAPRRTTSVALAGLLLLGTMLQSGCAVAMWNKAELKLTRTVSFGQEFRDLKAARDEGAISEEEWQRLKSNLMEVVNFEEGITEIADDVHVEFDADKD